MMRLLLPQDGNSGNARKLRKLLKQQDDDLYNFKLCGDVCDPSLSGTSDEDMCLPKWAPEADTDSDNDS